MDLLKRENVQILTGASDWKDAIYQCVQPLENGGYVEARYKDGIIANVEKFGPYFVVAEHIAMPHARPEQGAIQTQISVTLFLHDISFNEDTTARLFITLAAKDNEKHLEALAHLSNLLGEDENVEKILSSPDAATLYKYFNE